MLAKTNQYLLMLFGANRTLTRGSALWCFRISRTDSHEMKLRTNFISYLRSYILQFSAWVLLCHDALASVPGNFTFSVCLSQFYFLNYQRLTVAKIYDRIFGSLYYYRFWVFIFLMIIRVCLLTLYVPLL